MRDEVAYQKALNEARAESAELAATFQGMVNYNEAQIARWQKNRPWGVQRSGLADGPQRLHPSHILKVARLRLEERRRLQAQPHIALAQSIAQAERHLLDAVARIGAARAACDRDTNANAERIHDILTEVEEMARQAGIACDQGAAVAEAMRSKAAEAGQ